MSVSLKVSINENGVKAVYVFGYSIIQILTGLSYKILFVGFFTGIKHWNLLYVC